MELDKIINVVVFAGTCEFKTEIPKECVRLNNLVAKIRSFENEIIEPARLFSSINNIKTARLENTITNKIRHVDELNRKHAPDNFYPHKKRSNIFDYLLRVGYRFTYPLLAIIVFFIFMNLVSIQSVKVITDIANKNITVQKSLKNKQEQKNNIQPVFVAPQPIQSPYTSPPTLTGNKSVAGDSGNNSKKYKNALYSWTNERGQKVYSNVGFPQDRAYSDQKIEWR